MLWRFARQLLFLGIVPVWLVGSPALANAGKEEKSDDLKLVLKELEAIKEGQQAILDGQQKLSEEHKQLKYWIHHRG